MSDETNTSKKYHVPNADDYNFEGQYTCSSMQCEALSWSLIGPLQECVGCWRSLMTAAPGRSRVAGQRCQNTPESAGRESPRARFRRLIWTLKLRSWRVIEIHSIPNKHSVAPVAVVFVLSLPVPALTRSSPPKGSTNKQVHEFLFCLHTTACAPPTRPVLEQ